MNIRSLSNKAFSIFQRDALLLITKIATGAIIARTLGPATLGIWAILSLVPSYSEALGRLKADVAAVYLIGQKKFRREDLLADLNVIALGSSATILAIILWQFEPIYGWLFRGEEEDYRLEMLVLMTQIPLQFLYSNYCYFHLAEENTHAYNRMIIIHAWSSSIITIGLLILTSLDLWAVIIGAILGTLLSLLFGWRSIDRTDWMGATISIGIIFKIIRYGLSFYYSGLLGQLHEAGTRLIAVGFLSSTQMSFLAQGQGLGQLLSKVADACNAVLYPRISRLNVDDAATTSCRAFRLTVLLLVPAGVFMAIVAEQMIKLLYGAAFLPTAHVFYYLMPGLVVSAACSTLSNYFTGTGRASVIPRVQIFPVMVQILLAWLLSRWKGLNGAAAAISIGLSIYGLFMLAVFVRVSKVPVKKLMPRIDDVRYLLRFVLERTFK